MRLYSKSVMAAAFAVSMLLTSTALASPPPTPTTPVAVDPAPLALPPVPGAQNTVGAVPTAPTTPAPAANANDPFNPLNSNPPAASSAANTTIAPTSTTGTNIPVANSAPTPSGAPSANNGGFDPFANNPPSGGKAPLPSANPPAPAASANAAPQGLPLAIPNSPMTIPPPEVAPDAKTMLPTTNSNATPFGSLTGDQAPGSNNMIPPAPNSSDPVPVEKKAKPKPKFKPSMTAGKKAFDKGQFDVAKRNLLPFAKKGDAEAAYLMGVIYSHDKAKSRDYQQAAEWYDKAAAKGMKEAQFNLGFMLYHGAGDAGDKKSVASDPKQAATYLTMAAQQGVPMAQHLLSLLYLRGAGVAANYTEALRWASLAADNGIDESMFNAAMLGVRRPGATMQDYISSYKWFTILAMRGYPGAAENRAMITRFMPVGAIQYAEGLARNWKAPNIDSALPGMESTKPQTMNQGGWSPTSGPAAMGGMPYYYNPADINAVSPAYPAPLPAGTLPLMPPPGTSPAVPPAAPISATTPTANTNNSWTMGMEKVPQTGQPQMAQPMSNPYAWPWGPSETNDGQPKPHPYPQIMERERYMMPN